MTDKTDSKEREAFEDWASRSIGRVWRDTTPGRTDCYQDASTNIGWRAWQARASLAASAGSEPVAWVDERALRWLANSRSLSATITTKLEKGKSFERPTPLYLHPSLPEGMVGGLQVYRCKIKSRKQIDREIPRELQGWWADVAAGQKLLLRQAVQSDLDRCNLGGKRSRNPADYMCETHTYGSLVSKVALEYMNPEENVFAAPPTTSAGSGKGE